MARAGALEDTPASEFVTKRATEAREMSIFGELAASAFALDKAWLDRTYADAALLDAPALGFYITYRRDVPMSAVCTSGAGSTVGIWTMSTPPEKQRQGAGRAVLVAAMQDHLKRGADTFYLIATAAGKPLYDSLGFKTVDELSIWLVGESTQCPAQAPAGRAYAAMAYDSLRAHTVFFGGDTWEWDGSHWSTFLTTVAPPSSIGPGMVYDSDRHLTVLLDNSGNTWEWNGSNWVQRATPVSPPARVWTSMAYDSFRHRTVLFGGSASGGVDLGDTWTYDGTNWSKMAPTSAPSARFGMAMSFDSVRNVVVLFGGRVAGQRMNDTWEWDGASWTQRTPTTLPLPRFWHSMAYDAQLGVTVMWGGDHIE